jgi:hypothetical protein
MAKRKADAHLEEFRQAVLEQITGKPQRRSRSKPKPLPPAEPVPETVFQPPAGMVPTAMNVSTDDKHGLVVFTVAHLPPMAMSPEGAAQIANRLLAAAHHLRRK